LAVLTFVRPVAMLVIVSAFFEDAEAALHGSQTTKGADDGAPPIHDFCF
jgi:hypothetical protein